MTRVDRIIARPSRKPVRRRSQAERREESETQIVEAAIGLIAERGLDGLTMSDLADAAGCSRGLPLHYFQSKSDLLLAIAAHIRGWFIQGMTQHIGRRQGLDSLVAAVDFYFDRFRTDRRMLQALHIVLTGALTNPVLRAAAAEFNRASIALAAAALRHDIAKGNVRRGIDSKALATHILATVRGMVELWLADPRGIDLEPIRQSIVASLRRAASRRKS